MTRISQQFLLEVDFSDTKYNNHLTISAFFLCFYFKTLFTFIHQYFFFFSFINQFKNGCEFLNLEDFTVYPTFKIFSFYLYFCYCWLLSGAV